MSKLSSPGFTFVFVLRFRLQASRHEGLTLFVSFPIVRLQASQSQHESSVSKIRGTNRPSPSFFSFPIVRFSADFGLEREIWLEVCFNFCLNYLFTEIAKVNIGVFKASILGDFFFSK